MKEFLFVTALFLSVNLLAQPIQVGIDLSTTYQEIDGFGAHQGNAETNQAWWQELYYDDLGASMYRVDLTPRLKSPYSDLSYYSPWFMGSQTNSVFNLEDPDNPDGPEGNRVRTYTGPEDYSREFGGLHAPIAVMGPDIEENVKLFTFPNDGAIQAGIDRKEQLGDFKLIGSLWSPVPWVKIPAGTPGARVGGRDRSLVRPGRSSGVATSPAACWTYPARYTTSLTTVPWVVQARPVR